MERIELESFQLDSLIEEHLHRYQLAQQYARGIVVDCACGIGYAAKLFMENPLVTEYYGFDNDAEAIAVATQKTDEKIKFSIGTITRLPFENNTVDTFVSLETLEHLEDPEQALREIKRVLKRDGVFICSVPTGHYEDFCNKIYGPNPHHLQKFTLEQMESKIGSFFKQIHSFIVSQEVVSFAYSLNRGCQKTAKITHAIDKEYLDGSFLFVSSDSPIKHQGTFLFTGLSRIQYDEERLVPIRQAMKFAEHLADERLVAMRFAENLAIERFVAMRRAEELANERLIAMRFAEQLAEERQVLILKYEAIINRSDVLNPSQQKMDNNKIQKKPNKTQLLKKGKK